MPTPKTPQLTLKQQVALPIAAAIHSRLAFQILDAKDGELAKKITDVSMEFAVKFLEAA